MLLAWPPPIRKSHRNSDPLSENIPHAGVERLTGTTNAILLEDRERLDHQVDAPSLLVAPVSVVGAHDGQLPAVQVADDHEVVEAGVAVVAEEAEEVPFLA